MQTINISAEELLKSSESINFKELFYKELYLKDVVQEHMSNITAKQNSLKRAEKVLKSIFD